MLKVPNSIVDCHWLHKYLYEENLIILDATLPKVASKETENKNQTLQIPLARFFDIKGRFSKAGARFPNTMLSAKEFENEAQNLGISQNSCVVVYDDHGIYSSPRAWWMFRSMGFENSAVLNGGLPAWKELNFQLLPKKEAVYSKGDFKSKPIENAFVDFSFVLNRLENEHFQMLDARSLERFEGTEPEPRPEVRSGHIPHAKNLPYEQLLNGNALKDKDQLQAIFQELTVENQSLVFSCGSGITACILALGAEVSGIEHFHVYDGSWTEWGSLAHLPIEIKKNENE